MNQTNGKAQTGIAGLDDVLDGGFSRGHIKIRTGRHESTIREYRIDADGLSLGEPLEEFQGVLRGVPQYAGGRAPLLADENP